MTEQSYQETDIKPMMSVCSVRETPTMHSSKRKRELLDEEGRSPPNNTSPIYQHVSTPPVNSVGNSDLNEQTTASLLAVHNAAAGPNENNMHISGNHGLDFNSLSQHTTHGLHQTEGSNQPNVSDTAAAALSHYTMNVPQPTELPFEDQRPNNERSRQINTSFTMNEPPSPHGIPDFNLDTLKRAPPGTGPIHESPSASAHKPPVGSEEWHKVRRDNHKEVERRRRETINEGIGELSKIVPNCEKNKGSILQRAVQYITQLKENESRNIEKWTLEKLLTEQAISELSASCDKLKSECQRAWGEVEEWKNACKAHSAMPKESKSPIEDENEQANGDG